LTAEARRLSSRQAKVGPPTPASPLATRDPLTQEGAAKKPHAMRPSR